MKKEAILSHELVPKHEIITEEEVNSLIKEYGITVDQLPKIRSDDPIVKIIGAKKGQVLKITRNSPTAGEYYYYRVVI